MPNTNLEELKQSVLERVNADASQVNDLSCSNDFLGAERQIDALRIFISSAIFNNENELNLANLRFHDCAGRHWNYRAVHSFTAEVDPLDSNTFSHRSIDHHEQALAHAKLIEVGDSDEANALEANLVAMHQANVDDARGMQELSAGEIQLKSGQFPRALKTLRKAHKHLTKAEVWFIADARQNNLPPSPGYGDVAKAFIEETKSEIALIQGALNEAAEAEKARAAALEAATRKHAISNLSTSHYFSRRLKTDAEFAHARARLFSDANKNKVKQPWFASYLFFVLAIGSSVGLVYVLGRSEIINSPYAIGLIFMFVFVVAGVATKLGKWSEGAALLANLSKSSAKDD